MRWALGLHTRKLAARYPSGMAYEYPENLCLRWHWQKAAGTPKTRHTFSSEYLGFVLLL